MADLTVDVTSLSRYRAAEYRHELVEVINYHPETDLDVIDPDFEKDLEMYKGKLAEVNEYLKTFE